MRIVMYTYLYNTHFTYLHEFHVAKWCLRIKSNNNMCSSVIMASTIVSICMCIPLCMNQASTQDIHVRTCTLYSGVHSVGEWYEDVTHCRNVHFDMNSSMNDVYKHTTIMYVLTYVYLDYIEGTLHSQDSDIREFIDAMTSHLNPLLPSPTHTYIHTVTIHVYCVLCNVMCTFIL